MRHRCGLRVSFAYPELLPLRRGGVCRHPQTYQSLSPISHTINSCKGCSYTANCCCAAKDALPVTIKKTVITARTTRTVSKFVTKTITPPKKNRRSDFDAEALQRRKFEMVDANSVEPIEAAEPIDNQETLEARQLYAETIQDEADDGLSGFDSRAAGSVANGGKHNCPVCPAGVKVLAKNNGGSAVYCWYVGKLLLVDHSPNSYPEHIFTSSPRRKTVTKWVRKIRTFTKTAIKTKTATKYPRIYIRGQAYLDRNKNGKYDAGIDVPLAKHKVFIKIKKKVAKGRVLARQDPTELELDPVVCDEQGYYTVSADPPIEDIPSDPVMEGYLDDPTNDPFIFFYPGPDDTFVSPNPVNNPSPLIPPNPTDPPTQRIDKASYNKVEARGLYANSSLKVGLYDNGVRIASFSSQAAPSTYILNATGLRSGSHTFTIRNIDPIGAESDPVDAGAASIPWPPRNNMFDDNGVTKIVKVTFRPDSAGLVKLYLDGKVDATMNIDAAGVSKYTSISSTTPYTIGVEHIIYLTMTDADSNESDKDQEYKFSHNPPPILSSSETFFTGTLTSGTVLSTLTGTAFTTNTGTDFSTPTGTVFSTAGATTAGGASQTTVAGGSSQTTAPQQTTTTEQVSTTAGATTTRPTTTAGYTAGSHLPLSYVGFGGGTQGKFIATDSTGNVYVLAQFDIGSGTSASSPNFNYTQMGSKDCVVYKIDATTKDIAWIQGYGGVGDCNPNAGLVVTSDGSKVFLGGMSSGMIAPINVTSNNVNRIFIGAIDASTGAALWTNIYGASNNEFLTSIAADSSNNVYASGFWKTAGWFQAGQPASNAADTSVFYFQIFSNGTSSWLSTPQLGSGKGICATQSNALFGLSFNETVAARGTAILFTIDLGTGAATQIATVSPNVSLFDSFVCSGEKAHIFFSTYKATQAPVVGGVTGNMTGTSDSKVYITAVNSSGLASSVVRLGNGNSDPPSHSFAVVANGYIVQGGVTTNPFNGTSQSDEYVAKYNFAGTCVAAYGMGIGIGIDGIGGVAVQSNGNVLATTEAMGPVELGSVSGNSTGGYNQGAFSIQLGSDLKPLIW